MNWASSGFSRSSRSRMAMAYSLPWEATSSARTAAATSLLTTGSRSMRASSGFGPVDLGEGRPDVGRAPGDPDAGLLHRLDLVGRLSAAARDDGAGMAHALARRRGLAADETDDRLL